MPVEDWHVERLVAQMRQGDRDEMAKLYGITPREGLESSLAQRGRHWTGLFDGQPGAIFGIVPVTVSGGSAVIWLLGTQAVVDNSRGFLRMSRKVVRELLDRYDVLFNIVHAENTLALRWLHWLGATFKQNGDRIFFEIRGR